MSFHLSRLYLVPFDNVLYFSDSTFCTCFVKFTAESFILFCAIVDRIVFSVIFRLFFPSVEKYN